MSNTWPSAGSAIQPEAPEELSITSSRGLSIALRSWGGPTSPHSSATTPPPAPPVRVLAYPGWLDNVGSFDALAPVLCAQLGWHVVAVDPPGCGHTDHLPPTAVYNDYEEAPLVLDVLDALGWTDPVVILGHSRGGGVVALFAGVFPERVRAVVFLDSWMGLSGSYPPGRTLAQAMRVAVTTDMKNRQRRARVFASKEEAYQASFNHPWFPKTMATARSIVDRHLTPTKDGRWTFTHDVRTYGQSQVVHLDEARMLQTLECISAPCLLIKANQDQPRKGMLATGFDTEALTKLSRVRDEVTARRLQRIKLAAVTTVTGGHHIHSDQPVLIASCIADWWQRPEVQASMPPHDQPSSSKAAQSKL